MEERSAGRIGSLADRPSDGSLAMTSAAVRHHRLKIPDLERFVQDPRPFSLDRADGGAFRIAAREDDRQVGQALAKLLAHCSSVHSWHGETGS